MHVLRAAWGEVVVGEVVRVRWGRQEVRRGQASSQEKGGGGEVVEGGGMLATGSDDRLARIWSVGAELRRARIRGWGLEGQRYGENSDVGGLYG